MDTTEPKKQVVLLGGWWPEERKVLVEAQGHLFRVKVPLSAPKGGAIRGAILGFTGRSRKRMLETLARVDLERAGFVCFVTLTYPDRTGPPTAEETERDRCTFLKRMRRGFPTAAAVWRREWEARDSGDFVGVSFPHYHLLFFGLPFVRYSEINQTWGEVLGWTGYLRTEIKGIENWRHALAYVAKYMAKAEPVRAPGSPAGVGADGPAEPEGAGREAPGGSLVYGTYLTEGIGVKRTGRAWGVFNRKRILWAEHRHLALKRGGWLKDAKSLAHEQWGGLDERAPGGFTLFVDEAQNWLEAIRRLAEDEAEGGVKVAVGQGGLGFDMGDAPCLL